MSFTIILLIYNFCKLFYKFKCFYPVKTHVFLVSFSFLESGNFPENADCSLSCARKSSTLDVTLIRKFFGFRILKIFTFSRQCEFDSGHKWIDAFEIASVLDKETLIYQLSYLNYV